METSKVEIRTIVKTRMEAVSSEKKTKKSTEICQVLLKLLPREPFSICAYVPLPDEVDITPVLHEILARGCRLFLPRYTDAGLSFHAVASLESELTTGAFEIVEPEPYLPPLDPSTLRLALVPGRAFDRSGNRIGRGKGAYDAWIARQREENASTEFWGIAFQEQIFDMIPREAHDQQMNRVVTDSND